MLVPTSSKLVLVILTQGVVVAIPLYGAPTLAVTQSLTLVGMTSLQISASGFGGGLGRHCPEHERFYNWCICQ